MRILRLILLGSVFVFAGLAHGQWISAISVTPTTDSATIQWTSCTEANSRVNYGLTASHGSQVKSATLTTSHSLLIPSLSPGTTYHYSISSTDSTGVNVATKDFTFTTAPAPPTMKPNLTWTASTSTVAGYNVYRSTVSGGPYSKVNSSLITGTSYIDSFAMTGTWYYVATAVDSSGQESIFSNEIQMVVP